MRYIIAYSLKDTIKKNVDYYYVYEKLKKIKLFK